MKPLESARVERARRVLDEVRSEWLSRPGVTGIDVGLRERDGEITDEVAIRVYVERKTERAALDPMTAFPENESGVPVDVLVFPPGGTPSP